MDPAPPTVRPARTSDARRIAEFQRAMALETEGKELDEDVVLAGVRRALRDPAKARYLVAELGGEVVSCLGLTLEWSDWRNGWFWWIQSVYTAPEERGCGAYRALYEEVLSQARAADDVLGVRLYVATENAAARAVYEKLGMREVGYRPYEADLV